MNRMLSKKQIAEILDMSARTIERWIDEGRFPKPAIYLHGEFPRWHEAVIYAWMGTQPTEPAKAEKPLKSK